MSDATGSPRDAAPQPFVPLARTLLRAFRAADQATMDALAQAGFRGNGPASWELLRALPTAGARASALARKLGVTKQAVGQVLKELERRGYVIREADPADRRARRVRPTEAGRRVVEHGERILRAEEGRWAEALGRTRLRALRLALDDLAAELEPEEV